MVDRSLSGKVVDHVWYGVLRHCGFHWSVVATSGLTKYQHLTPRRAPSQLPGDLDISACCLHLCTSLRPKFSNQSAHRTFHLIRGLAAVATSRPLVLEKPRMGRNLGRGDGGRFRRATSTSFLLVLLFIAQVSSLWLQRPFQRAVAQVLPLQYLTSRGVFVVPTAPSELYQDEFETVVRPEIVKADIRRTQI